MGASGVFFRAASATAIKVLCARLRWVLFYLACTLGGAVASAQQAPNAQASDPRELLEQLNSVSIDPAQIYVLRNAQIARDRVKIYFNRGFIGFSTKVAGELTGAAFTGDGEVLLIPPSSVEKRNLAQFIQSPILEERFSSIYLRFTDQTAQELLTMARRPDPEDLEQPSGFAERWAPAVRQLSPDHSLRILQDLWGARDFPYFDAQIQGVNLDVFEVIEDERLSEAVSVGAGRRSQRKLYADTWCSFPSRASEARAAALTVGSVRMHSCKIDTRISADDSLEGRAELELESRSSADRVLGFELSRQLAVSEVRDGQGQSLVWFQNPSLEESEVAARGNDRIVAVLPSTHPVGEKFRLSFTYRGNVIADVGNGVLYVGAHGSWYPNRGLRAHATYDLTFHYPDRFTLAATGKRVEESSSQGWKHSRWVSDGAFPVAGFNMGAYDSSVRRVGNTTIEVYATPEAETSLEKLHLAGQPPAGLVVQQLGERKVPVGVIPSQVAPLAPAALLDSVAEKAASAVQYFENLFGPFPYPRLAISQIPGSFAQGWPELIYLPTLSFLPRAERSGLGLSAQSGELQDQLFLAHEIAHQWWGNEVGWKTYRDQWLSEGFASYAAALYLAREKDGDRKFHELLRGYKHDLLSKTKKGNTVESGGPIWLGERLSNSLNPEGYNNIVYKKACWVLHMLRGLMTDSGTGADENFFKMLRDLVIAYRGQNPSTEDFMRHAEKYMTRASDLEHNHRLDWFFNEWVYSTGIPTYKLESITRRLGPDKFVVQGRIEQSDVPAEFEMLVPVVAQYGKEHKMTLGRVVVGDAGGRFRFTTSSKPIRVTIDEENLLAVVH